MHISLSDIMDMDSMYRRNLMNTLPGPRGVHLIGTKGHSGVENLGVFSSVVHIGANPPLLGFIMRPLTVPRQTYHHIQASGFFTLNTIQPDILEQAHQTSAKYEMKESEFAATGLNPFYGKHCKAPYVAESQIKIGLRLEEEHRIQANDTIFLVGAVVEVIIPDKAVAETGHVAHEQLDTMTVVGLDSYYSVEGLQRLGYARP
ncbi:MAG: flavin reductase family protein [Bacteroidota bacterium]